MKQQRALTLLAILLLSLVLATAVLAQSSGVRIDWQVMGTGGGSGSAGAVTVNDTLGQPVAGTSASSDSRVVLSAGYWAGRPAVVNKIHLPLIRR